MPSKSLPQVELEVKCDAGGCNEPQFRASGLCYYHFIQEELAARNDRDALDGAWWGDPVGEVCR